MEKKQSDHYNDSKLLTEPVIRPDGLSFQIEKSIQGLISVNQFGVESFYTQDEVTKLGEGDFAMGLARIGQAYYSAEPSQMLIGRTRLLHKELTADYSNP